MPGSHLVTINVEDEADRMRDPRAVLVCAATCLFTITLRRLRRLG
jgi:hypothetical protein